MNFPQFIQEFQSKKDTDELGSNSSEDSQKDIEFEKNIEATETSLTIDPNILTKLFECPLCLAKLGSFQKAHKHLEQFHRLDTENQTRIGTFGLKIREISISTI